MSKDLIHNKITKEINLLSNNKYNEEYLDEYVKYKLANEVDLSSLDIKNFAIELVEELKLDD